MRLFCVIRSPITLQPCPITYKRILFVLHPLLSMAALFCFIVHTHVSALPCTQYYPVPRGDSRKYLYPNGSLLHRLLSRAAGGLVHPPLGLHLTNLESKPCKSIQLEVNGSAGSCQQQTGLHPAQSQRSSSADGEGPSQTH